jgi:hypothetical protein
VKRLLETRPLGGPEEERLAELIKAAPQVGLSATKKRQLFAAVLARRSHHPDWSTRLRPVLVLVALLLTGATAAATLSPKWILERVKTLIAPTRDSPTLPAPQPSRARHAPMPEPRAPSLAPAADDPTTALPPPAPRLVARSSVRETERMRASPHDDPSRLVEAIRALRTDRDPTRAAGLLAEYLKLYPHGALAEEALALSIEAAADRKDPSAAAFAEQYVRKYPSGRFRRAADQALAQGR